MPHPRLVCLLLCSGLAACGEPASFDESYAAQDEALRGNAALMERELAERIRLSRAAADALERGEAHNAAMGNAAAVER